MKRKSIMKKLTSLVLCLVTSMGVAFAAPTIPTSDPSASPGDGWNLVKVIDFERDGGFTLNQKANGTSYSYIKEDADTLTGWYLEHDGVTSSTAFTDSVPGFPTLNQDAVSVKFKFWADDDWGSTAHVAISMGPTTITVMPKTSSYEGWFTTNDHSSGYATSLKGFRDAQGNKIVYKDGWNDIEIRLFKDVPGVDQNYTRAEYYFNGVQGTATKDSTLNTTRTMCNTASYPLDVRCGEVKCISRFDEIYVYSTSTTGLSTLSDPANVTLNANGTVGFDEVANATSYAVKLYKDSNLVASKTVLADESKTFSFNDEIFRCGNGTYEVSVQAKGNFTTYCNSQVAYSSPVYCSTSWNLKNVIDFERDSGFALEQKATGTSNSYIKEDANTITGWYLEHNGTLNSSTFNDPVPGFPTLNQDAVSVKFKFWADDDWDNGGHVVISMGPTTITVMPKTSSYGGWFVTNDNAIGWPNSPKGFRDDQGNKIAYKDGWNDIEIRLFKDVSGVDQNYTRAEYYFNGVQGILTKDSTLNTARPAMSNTADYPLNIRCGNGTSNAKCLTRIDDICISDFSADTLTKLSAPANVSVGAGGVVSFAEVAGAKGYAVKLYKDDNLIATKTVTADDNPKSAGFGLLIYELGDGEYTFTVNAKGNYSTNKNSDESSVSGFEFTKYGPYLVSGSTVSATKNNNTLTFNASTNLLRGAADGTAPYTFIVALYEDGNMVGVDTCVLDESAVEAIGESATLSGTVSATTVSSDFSKISAKIFSWEDFTKLRPITGIEGIGLKEYSTTDIEGMFDLAE